MAAAIETYPVLSKENFVETEWLGPEGGLPDVAPRYQGYVAELPERGVTTLYPLRENSFGQILPHIYQEQMRRVDRRDRIEPLSSVHMRVNRMYELNGSCDSDETTHAFLGILRTLEESPYSDMQPELASQQQEIFEEYVAMRASKRNRVASNLSSIIGAYELYVVASDSSESRIPAGERLLYTARLSGVVHERNEHRMKYSLVVSDADGNKGFLPPTFHVPAGVSAPTAPDAA